MEPVRRHQPGPAGLARKFRPPLRGADRAQSRCERAAIAARSDPAVHAATNQERRALGIAAAHGSHSEIDLPEDERAFYEALRCAPWRRSRMLNEKGGGGQNRIHILAEITKLRRACCHPGLIDPATLLPGAKLQAFLELVDDLIRNKHKALVFSQFVGQLERVREALSSREASPINISTAGLPPGARKAGGRVSGGAGRPLPDQPEGRRHGAQSHGCRLCHPSRSLVESRRRGPGQRPRPPHRPAASRHRLSAHRARTRSKKRSSSCTARNAISPAICSRVQKSAPNCRKRIC